MHARGWIHRRKLKIMHKASTIIQCLARCRQARLRVVRERKRRNGGPEVVEMLRRGACISGFKLTVVVYRCGGSYKIVGHDLMNSCQYIGFIYEPEVQRILGAYNSEIQVSLTTYRCHGLLMLACREIVAVPSYLE
jgi:hypothetical protein